MKQGDRVIYTGALSGLSGKSGKIEAIGSSIVWVQFKDNSVYGIRPENLKSAPNRFKLWATKHTEALTAIGMALCIFAVWATVIIMIGGKL